AQSNLGAVPAYQAIQNAKQEVIGDGDSVAAIDWADSSISSLHKGWCVQLHGFELGSGKPHNIPVFVEQDGRAWRTDAVGKRKYNGGGDGLYMPPLVASECRLTRDK
ncbi:MAG TPA: hypothetical protein VGM36_04255, partial [Rhizomicrobium sp.]